MTLQPIVVVLLDGVADRAHDVLGGRTGVEAARTPNLDALCASGSCGVIYAVGPGRAPSSEVAHWSLLGYRPDEFPGRAEHLARLKFDVLVGRRERHVKIAESFALGGQNLNILFQFVRQRRAGAQRVASPLPQNHRVRVRVFLRLDPLDFLPRGGQLFFLGFRFGLLRFLFLVFRGARRRG